MTYFIEFYKGDEIVGKRSLRARHRDEAITEATTLFRQQASLLNPADKALVFFNLKSESMLFAEVNAHGWFHGDGYEAVEEHEAGPKPVEDEEDPADRLHREWLNRNDRND